ncbi:hypothetical protein MTR_0059s0080 [Medicago truncatula]|uniref:Uncharacterized protein n=1 Tax=Medicago truncatula TaxID=3880 RepID=A0A072TJC0_MEDTR|nr:hypothetical protein MTR_0059s0080 [Medicago truncatula]
MEQLYGMPTSMMENVHNSVSASADQANPFTTHNAHSPSSSSIFGQNTLPVLSSDSMNLLRQQIDESNHEMVNLLTQEIGTVFNPLIRDTNRSYQALTTQMGRIKDFLLLHNMPQLVPQPQPVEPVIQVQPEVVLVDRNHDAYEVVRKVKQQNIGAHNKIANLVENIMAQNGLNIGLHRPNFVSPLLKLVLRSKLPRGYKIPKFTKFEGDTSESEHIARYLTKVGDLENDENLRFKLLKARCFTQVPKHELVEMTAGGLDYSIRKKLDTQHLRDIDKLADRVRHFERLRAEKVRTQKYHKR